MIASQKRRDVIVHYHLFKNGGSSIERMLHNSFGDKFQPFDRDQSSGRIPASELQQYLQKNPAIRAVSSHQLLPPVISGEFRVMPVIFLRHPLIRVRSAYLFEWQKQLGLDIPKASLADYIESKFENSFSSVIADFQVSRLSHVDYDNPRQDMGKHDVQPLERAQSLLDNLPFFGLVERFPDSLTWMRSVANPRFPELDITEYKENVLQNDSRTAADRLDALRAEIGDPLYDELCHRNQRDLQLYAYALGRFNQAMQSIAANPPKPTLVSRLRAATATR